MTCCNDQEMLLVRFLKSRRTAVSGPELAAMLGRIARSFVGVKNDQPS